MELGLSGGTLFHGEGMWQALFFVSLTVYLGSLDSAVGEVHASKVVKKSSNKITPKQQKEFNELVCLKEYFGGLTKNGRPKYWAQFQVRPPRRTYPKTKSVSWIATGDIGAIDYSDPALECQFGRGQQCVQGERESHASNTLALICSKAGCSISPQGTARHVYFESPNVTDHYGGMIEFLEEVRSYNRWASDEKKIREVNLSMGGIYGNIDISARELSFFKKIEEENEFNITISAGNGFAFPVNMPTPPFFLVVSSLGEVNTSLSQYSDFGPSVDFTAPSGNSIQSIGDDLFGGTSGAAPVVSGALVTVSQYQPKYTARSRRALVKATAQELGKKGKDIYFGYGVPNPRLAIAVAERIAANKINALNEDDAIKLVRSELSKFSKEYEAKIQAEKVTAEKLSNSKDCKSYSSKLDTLLSQYHLGQRQDAQKKELCNLFRKHKLKWGILNFCAVETIVASFGKDTLWQDIQLLPLFRQYISENPDEKTKEWARNAIQSAAKRHGFSAMRDLLPYKVVRNTLGDKQLRKIVPQLAQQYPKYATRLLFPIPTLMRHPDYPKWVRLSKEKDKNQDFPEALLGSQQFAKLHPKLWKELITHQLSLRHDTQREAINREVLSQSWVYDRDPKYWNEVLNDKRNNGVIYKIRYLMLNPQIQKRNPKWTKDQIGRWIGTNHILNAILLPDPWVKKNFPKQWEKALDESPDAEVIALLSNFTDHPRWKKLLEKAEESRDFEENAAKILANPMIQKLDPELWERMVRRYVPTSLVTSPRVQKLYPKKAKQWVHRALLKTPNDPWVKSFLMKKNLTEFFGKDLEESLMANPTVAVHLLATGQLNGHPKFSEWVKQVIPTKPARTEKERDEMQSSLETLFSSPLVFKQDPKLYVTSLKVAADFMKRDTEDKILRNEWLLKANPKAWKEFYETTRPKTALYRASVAEQFPKDWQNWIERETKEKASDRAGILSSHLAPYLSTEQVKRWGDELVKNKRVALSEYEASFLVNEWLVKEHPKLWENWMTGLIDRHPVLVRDRIFQIDPEEVPVQGVRQILLHPSYERLMTRLQNRLSMPRP